MFPHFSFFSKTIKAFVPDMISKNHGHIITIASGAGLFGIAGMVDYCSSKFAAVGIHESLTMELDAIGCTNVKTLCVCPYFIDTGMFAGIKTRQELLYMCVLAHIHVHVLN